MRIKMIYYGSLILLAAYVLFLWYSPRLLRNKRDRQHFISDMIVSRDRSTIAQIVSSVTKYLKQYLALRPASPEPLRELLNLLTSRSTKIGTGAGEYEDDIPRVLAFYFNWQNFTRPKIRALIFGLTVIGYCMLILPAIDLFLRVIGTDLHNLVG